MNELDLRLEKFVAQQAISRQMLTLTQHDDDLMMDMTIMRLVRMVATLPARDRIVVPDGWVQALKEAEAKRSPLMRWIVSRWPVRQRVYEARAYLPDFVVEGRKPFQARVLDIHEMYGP